MLIWICFRYFLDPNRRAAGKFDAAGLARRPLVAALVAETLHFQPHFAGSLARRSRCGRQRSSAPFSSFHVLPRSQQAHPAETQRLFRRHCFRFRLKHLFSIVASPRNLWPGDRISIGFEHLANLFLKIFKNYPPGLYVRSQKILTCIESFRPLNKGNDVSWKKIFVISYRHKVILLLPLKANQTA